MSGPVAAVVPAAGSGTRLGSDRPKALVDVAGSPMVVRAVRGLLDAGTDVVVVAAPPEALDETRELCAGLDGSDRVRVVPGGVDRVDSVERALAELEDVAPEVVLVHDAARCLCPEGVVRAVIAAVRAGHAAVVPVVPVADTLRRVDVHAAVRGTVDRAGLVGVQTPQGFAADVLRRAHARAAASRAAGHGVLATDDAGLVEADHGTVVTVPGDPRAFKITTALDLAMAEALVVAGPA